MFDIDNLTTEPIFADSAGGTHGGTTRFEHRQTLASTIIISPQREQPEDTAPVLIRWWSATVATTAAWTT
ncbi:MAG: hypothetical protein ACLULJ_07690 [Alistipes onderdonkii]